MKDEKKYKKIYEKYEKNIKEVAKWKTEPQTWTYNVLIMYNTRITDFLIFVQLFYDIRIGETISMSYLKPYQS